MNDLEVARRIINEADEIIRKAFEKRMWAAELVANYKKQNNLPIFDEKREKEVLAKNIALIENPNYKSYYECLVKDLMTLSKNYQAKLFLPRFGLLGKSLKHSLSPLIHQSFYNFFDIAGYYELIESKEESLEDLVRDLRIGKYKGINVTIPYKKDLLPYLDHISMQAKKIGSINTIKVLDGQLYGYNTDYDGFKYLLERANINPQDKECYILGTGGASLAVYQVLVDLGAKKVTFVSRTSKAGAISYQELENCQIDLLVNATPVGMYPNVDASPINEIVASRTKEAVDLIYNPRRTKFLELVNSRNDGLPMLIYQAFVAEKIWHEKDFQFAEWYQKVSEELESIW